MRLTMRVRSATRHSRSRLGRLAPPSRSSGGSNFRGGSIATGSIGALIEKVRFAADSPLEEAGFEPSVPRQGTAFFTEGNELYPFVGDVEAALGQQFFDIAVAQGKAEIEPDRVLDDLGREPMAAITGQGHADILPYSATDPVSVTMPPPWHRIGVAINPDHAVGLDLAAGGVGSAFGGIVRAVHTALAMSLTLVGPRRVMWEAAGRRGTARSKRQRRHVSWRECKLR